MTEKPYTDADVEQLAAMVRARIGWPISAGEAGTIVTVVLQELAAAGRLAASPGRCTATVGAHQHSESCRVPVAGAVAGATPTTTTN